jgi:hypothetical protein
MRRPGLNLMFFAAFLATVSRGVFEQYASKTLGYLVQTLLWILFLALLQRSRERVEQRSAALVLYGFVILAVLSTALTQAIYNYSSAWIYTAVMMVFAVSLYLCGEFRFEAAEDIRFELWLAIVGVILVVVATAQQLEVSSFVFPGSDAASLDGTIRPASLTGSYLHYPLVICMFPFIFGQYFLEKRKIRYLLLAAFFAVAVVISYSRSGEMVLALGLLIFFFTASRTSTRVNLVFLGLLGLVAVAWLAPTSLYLERAMSALSLQGTGNTVRVERWQNGLRLWFDSPWLVGTHTGFATNIIKNLGTIDTHVVESGLIQQAVSFGLVGAALFYALLLMPRRMISPSYGWLRAGYLGAVLETFVYQSIEVFPFVITLCVISLLAQRLAADGPQPLGADTGQRQVGTTRV